jgi:hypothetical protein
VKAAFETYIIGLKGSTAKKWRGWGSRGVWSSVVWCRSIIAVELKLKLSKLQP